MIQSKLAHGFNSNFLKFNLFCKFLFLLFYSSPCVKFDLLYSRDWKRPRFFDRVIDKLRWLILRLVNFKWDFLLRFNCGESFWRLILRVFFRRLFTFFLRPFRGITLKCPNSVHSCQLHSSENFLLFFSGLLVIFLKLLSHLVIPKGFNVHIPKFTF